MLKRLRQGFKGFQKKADRNVSRAPINEEATPELQGKGTARNQAADAHGLESRAVKMSPGAATKTK